MSDSDGNQVLRVIVNFASAATRYSDCVSAYLRDNNEGFTAARLQSLSGEVFRDLLKPSLERGISPDYHHATRQLYGALVTRLQAVCAAFEVISKADNPFVDVAKARRESLEEVRRILDEILDLSVQAGDKEFRNSVW
ncbi:MAG: hypothetical protein K2W82_16505 [Candidatus Obscuribacterales bacterium]|nr:hypothetical protein [Candidatus Obscuribacterales bacterium]